MSDLMRLAERLVARAEPGEGIEVFVVRGHSTEVRVWNGSVESFTSADSAGVGVRVINDHRVGAATAGTLDESVLDETLGEARDNATFSKPDEWMELATPDGLTPIEHDRWNESVVTTPTESKIELAQRLENLTITLDPRVQDVRSATYSDSAVESALANSSGIRTIDRGTSAHIGVTALAKDGSETKVAGGFDFGFGFADLDCDMVANEAIERSTRLLGAQQPKSDRVTIVLEPRIAARLLGVAVGMLSGERLIKQRTPFAERLGEQIAVPILTIVDDPTNPDSFGASSVDGEGQTCRANTLIDGGVQRSFLHNTYTGRRSGHGTTANATLGLGGSPGVGVHAMTVMPGSGDLESLVGSVDNGVLVTSLSGLHSGVNAVSGDFSVGAEGLMIRNGSLGEPFREATIASTIQKMLQNVVAVGADTEWQPGGSGPVSIAIADVSLSGTN